MTNMQVICTKYDKAYYLNIFGCSVLKYAGNMQENMQENIQKNIQENMQKNMQENMTNMTKYLFRIFSENMHFPPCSW